MIIKVYCSDNTCKILQNVEEVNIHLPRFSFSTTKNCDELYSGSFGPITDYVLERGSDSIHYYQNLDPSLGSVGGVSCRIIDYRVKDRGWERLIVDCWAYVCNDDGKTVEKVDAQLKL